MRVFVLSLALSLAAATGVHAQGLRGVVVDSVGRPLREAEVIIVDPAMRTRTDSLGAFQWPRVTPGRRVLRVRLIGYRSHEVTVTVREAEPTVLRVSLQRTPALLSEVRITDTRLCAPNTIAGFECRRRSGVGHFRDAGELRSLRPSAWADMLDGMPDLRREAVMTRDGLDWRASALPSGCLVEIYNGEDPRFDGHVRKVPELELVPQDVVAIEYYTRYADVPEQFKRYAWPSESISPCNLLVYWLREAPQRRRPRRLPSAP